MQIQIIQHRIANDIGQNSRSVDLIDKGHAQAVDLCSPDDKKSLARWELRPGLHQAMNNLCTIDAVIGLARQDHGRSARQQSPDALVGFATHQQAMPHGQAFEAHKIGS